MTKVKVAEAVVAVVAVVAHRLFLQKEPMATLREAHLITAMEVVLKNHLCPWQEEIHGISPFKRKMMLRGLGLPQ